MKDFVELEKVLELCRDRDNYPPIFKYEADIVLPEFIKGEDRDYIENLINYESVEESTPSC